MRWLAFVTLALTIGCDPSITDPCPGQLSCPDDACCPLNYPYHCGTQCSVSPCGAGQITCVSATITDGCYAGTWSGSYSGTFHPAAGGNGVSISGPMAFQISSHTLISTSPAGGSGSIDCKTGVGSLVLPSSASQPLVFNGIWMHTSDTGDKIMSATLSATGGNTADGTWTAVRIY